MIALDVSLAAALLLCLGGLTAWFPIAATVAWVLLLETSPELWLTNEVDRETVIGVAKAAGLALAVILGLRAGFKRDRYNPGFAFLFMFVAGLIHGLYPGLSLLDSLRSLIGSAAPFVFGFVRLPASWCRAVVRAAIFGPVFAVAFWAVLSLAGQGSVVSFENGLMRLGGPGEPAFLGGFALIAIYALLLELLAQPRLLDCWMLVLNFVILLATGARAPLFLAAMLMFVAVLLPAPGLNAFRRMMILAGTGAVVSLGVMFSGVLSFIRAVGLAREGQTANLSNRDLVWPVFERAIAASPWFGWGTGAGKVVVPVGSGMSMLIGTNAAHDEYLRIAAEGGAVGAALLLGLMALWLWRGSAGLTYPRRMVLRMIMLAFAVHSATDNTLIATTSSVFFMWMSAVFASREEASKAAP
jgi:O-antigen ligase